MLHTHAEIDIYPFVWTHDWYLPIFELVIFSFCQFLEPAIYILTSPWGVGGRHLIINSKSIGRVIRSHQIRQRKKKGKGDNPRRKGGKLKKKWKYIFVVNSILLPNKIFWMFKCRKKRVNLRRLGEKKSNSSNKTPAWNVWPELKWALTSIEYFRYH